MASPAVAPSNVASTSLMDVHTLMRSPGYCSGADHLSSSSPHDASTGSEKETFTSTMSGVPKLMAAPARTP